MTDPMDVVSRSNVALSARDMDAAVACFTEDCVFEDTEPAPDGTRYVGRDALRGAWAGMLSDSGLRFESEEAFSAGDRVVQLLDVLVVRRPRARRAGVPSPRREDLRALRVRQGLIAAVRGDRG